MKHIICNKYNIAKQLFEAASIECRECREYSVFLSLIEVFVLYRTFLTTLTIIILDVCNEKYSK
jgi:hypothetical protein